MEIKPIGKIRSGFTDKFGIPRQSGRVSQVVGEIVLEREFSSPDCLRGIDEFSHLWIIFCFDRCDGKWSNTVRPPRLGGNERRGVFATRSPFRPNNLGLTVAKIEGVSFGENTTIKVSGIDLLDGTPVFDIKPYLPTADIVSCATGGFASENNSHKLGVEIACQTDEIDQTTLDAILGCIADDPRPAYHDDQRIYKMDYNGYKIEFSVLDNTATVISIKKV
ncbi:MAG: tRNA (N6-threonylcarbamoyladenosine(37)-N6)-methyltransferase TrmO [Clostridia bacterium]|nr:tRNA (N6-threonylcarbamoyladenosine(37)-N6)-methyltransferase TrmO [Clostridia bacterium]